MNYSLVLSGLAVLFFLLLFAAIQFGRRLGGRQGSNGKESGSLGSAAIEASVFALLGLLVAFTFSGAAQRMVERRNLLVQEVNAIGTAWLRIDMVNSDDQPMLRDQFRRYVDERINYYKNMANFDQRDQIAAKVGSIQQEIWTTSMQAAKRSVAPFAASYVGAVNDMFDVSTALTVAQKVHPPAATYVFLALLTLVCCCFVGMNLGSDKRGSVFHQVIYAFVMTGALYIIIDFEFPRIGTIRIDQSDALLISQRQAMGGSPSGGIK
ncbi:hypothetical protein PT7_1867 [Pusillimonas sp. T7-7]|uniref:bestrophin-like domain n=1 Tax=Pusillimonas sp. (strain T7-7) TaxID=1007105 RepID=UPI000208476C|nr:hypothetical protein [Pusillimonas sp. T7-7]AEC20407.1 hypothetical protein PT7_1867 [Pusillimonas sp. T7-7]